MKKIFILSLLASFLITTASAMAVSNEFVLQKSNINNSSIVSNVIEKPERPINDVRHIDPWGGTCPGILIPGEWNSNCVCTEGGFMVCYQF